MNTASIKRFWRSYEKDGHCWVWQGHLNRDGYGHISSDGKRMRVHRFSYELYVGPISEGLEIDHLCRVRNCVNPAHLEAVTHAENLRRGSNTWSGNHCKSGHELTINTAYANPITGQRYCKTCKNIRQGSARALKRLQISAQAQTDIPTPSASAAQHRNGLS